MICLEKNILNKFKMDYGTKWIVQNGPNFAVCNPKCACKIKKALEQGMIIENLLTDLVVKYRLVPLKIATFKKNYIWLKQKSIFTKFILRDSSKNKPLPSTLKKNL